MQLRLGRGDDEHTSSGLTGIVNSGATNVQTTTLSSANLLTGGLSTTSGGNIGVCAVDTTVAQTF